ncbi:enoyl-CoA hydratase/carnithine racemase [Caldalkalibacillus uzonensis]|uniref:Enoyl-CoA hydratase/carnithine racemase n=1 Tax=Caldalkalibacillus uzonensis TaxID=353224 RepID=A0ABU0CU34_9BACI|nr:enoyl-CoA hydratase/isomerase family protein [Caldalkalibacillus uzonensis]MDQ0339936.1 enoyl-CoA hydratase/carnithine racemase [Caldalkalibacillus uzonensis]
MNLVKLSQVTDKVVYLGLNRTEKKNALNRELMAEFNQDLDYIEQSHEIGVVVIEASDDAFSVGADIKKRSATTLMEALSLLTCNWRIASDKTILGMPED